MILTDEIKEKCTSLVRKVFKESERNKSDLQIPNREVNLSLSLSEDVSNSMNKLNKLHKAKKASIDLVDDLRKVSAEVGLISFGGKVRVEAPLTTDFTKVTNKISQFTAGGGTPFLRAMTVAQKEHFTRANGRKILVMDTDGKPSYKSQDRILSFGEELKQNDVRIITIGIGDKVNGNFLRKLASTPDDYYFAKAPKEIGDTFKEVTGTLVEQSV